jgi:negative regulator of flagellin synthesis FlgM
VKIDPTVTSTPSNSSPLNGSAQRTAQGDASTQNASNTPATSQTAAQSSTQASAQAASTQQDVNLSTLSLEVRGLSGGLTNASGGIDTKRVAEIKDAISKGNLSVDAGKIADGLIQTVRDLLQKPHEST